jgi:hypothetical protein
VLTAPIIALMVEAVSTSETSVSFYGTTWHIIPEDGDLQSIYLAILSGGLIDFDYLNKFY